MRWYDYIFGGSKAFLGLVAAGLITFVYKGFTEVHQAELFYHYVVAIIACLVSYGIFRTLEYKFNNKNNKG